MDETGKLKRALIDATAGAISGGISRSVTSPLDVIKIRFQVQLEPTSSWAFPRGDFYRPSKYTGILQATKDIFREEGLPVTFHFMVVTLDWMIRRVTVEPKLDFFGSIKSVYPIHSTLSSGPPIVRFLEGQCSSSAYGYALHCHTISSTAPCKNIGIWFIQNRGSSAVEFVSVLCEWGLAGCAATVGSYPFDLLRTILASQGEPKVYLNMRSALVDIVKNRGIRGLYAGLTPTLIEIIPYAGLQFGTYDTFKRWSMAWNKSRYADVDTVKVDVSLSSFQLFICGLASGSCAKAVCHPLDVVKKRFQIEGLRRHPKYGESLESHAYRNMYDALRQIIRREGPAGLYKGIYPSIIKAAPAGAVTFVAYEYSSDWLESVLT